jgi:hypothetical protein
LGGPEGGKRHSFGPLASQSRHNLRAKQGIETPTRICDMQTMMNGYQGISLLVGLNWDRIFSLATILVGLLAGAFLGTAITHP